MPNALVADDRVDLPDPERTTTGLPTLLDVAAREINTARCDAPMQARLRAEAGTSCGQRAYVITAHGDLPLAWCHHHYEELRPLRSGGVLVRDARARLTDPA